MTDHITAELNRPLRTEADAVRDRIRERLNARIATLAAANFLTPEQATEIQAHVNAECAIARPALRVVS